MPSRYVADLPCCVAYHDEVCQPPQAAQHASTCSVTAETKNGAQKTTDARLEPAVLRHLSLPWPTWWWPLTA